MVYIKKLVIHGFKSFARKTEIPLLDSMNVVVGPNGSGKSNITDALCFVLGRLSIKSIRAAKAANLLFSGNKMYKGANEASVELVFDNSDKVFSGYGIEVSLKRIVRKNGSSIYKIDNETKTRADLLELLSVGGIDPHGFNIVLQGEIQALVKASSEERRKILEDVAGISIYESRKERSLRELEKGEEKLKEVRGVLRERMGYLKNLEREKADAANFMKFELLIKDCKKTLIVYSMKEKEKEKWGVEKMIDHLTKEISRLQSTVNDKNVAIEELEVKIAVLEQKIDEVTGQSQDRLVSQIRDLRAELAGLVERRHQYESRIAEGKRKVEELDAKRVVLESRISEVKHSSPDVARQQKEHSKLTKELDILEQQRRRVYVVRSDLATLQHKRETYFHFMDRSVDDVEQLKRGISILLGEVGNLKSVREAEDLRLELRRELVELQSRRSVLRDSILSVEKEVAVLVSNISREEELVSSVESLTSCPVCLQEVCDEHKDGIRTESGTKITEMEHKQGELLIEKDSLHSDVEALEQKIDGITERLQDLEVWIVKLQNVDSRREELKRLEAQRADTSTSLKQLEAEISILEAERKELAGVEARYDDVRAKLQEMNFVHIDVDSEIGLIQRDISRVDVEKKSLVRELEEVGVSLEKLKVLLVDKEKELANLEKREADILVKTKGFVDEKNGLEDSQKVLETDIIGLQYNIRSNEEKLHLHREKISGIDASLVSLKEDIVEFSEANVLHGSVGEIRDRLSKAQLKISSLGHVNLRALEVYDQVAEQVRLIEEKLVTLESEREKIMGIIDEIDRKKKKAFMTTFTEVNSLFARNFSGLNHKGEVSLELEDKKDPFNGGVSIVVKMSRGRYFDVASLSGGEKTMIALALIFAIQEYRPYSFYIFDEIDAALDKHNSELLAGLIKKYMKTGQYIVITHNDTLISGASTLYGVSMQENISKVISLKV